MSERAPEVPSGNEEQFTDILNKWELFFETASEEEMNEKANMAQDELDENWRHMGELCIYSGKAIYPVLHEDGGVETAFGEVEDHTGVSTGVVILSVEDMRPRIFFSFNLSTYVEYKGIACVDIRKLAEYLETDGSITPIETIEDAFSEGLGAAAQNIELGQPSYLTRASDAFVGELRSTYFRRRLSRSDQEKFVRNYVQQVEERSGVRGRNVMVGTNVFYRHRMNDNRVDFDCVGLRSGTIQGICHGLQSLELLKLADKAIRRDMDMIDRDAGLCLVVEDFTNQEEDDEDLRGEIMLVPLSGKNLEVIFEGDDEEELY